MKCFFVLYGVHILGWPKSSFGFLCTMLWKSSNKLSDLPNITLKLIGKAGYQGPSHMYFQTVCIFLQLLFHPSEYLSSFPSCYVEVPLFLFVFLFFDGYLTFLTMDVP